MMIRRHRRAAAVLLTAAAVAMCASPVFAQLDPLHFLKRVPPTVIIVLDTGIRMLEDGQGSFYDPNTYVVAEDATVAVAFGLNTTTAITYRRIYRNLQYENKSDLNLKFEVTDITAVPNTAAGYGTFWDPTRLEIAKQGVAKAVGENASSAYRWGLVKLRQDAPAWRVPPDCEKPVVVTGNATLKASNDSAPCSGGGGAGSGKFAIYTPKIGAQPNYAIETAGGGGAVVVSAGANTASAILSLVNRGMNDPLGLIPAGGATRTHGDRPITHALDDAKAQAIAAMTADGTSTLSCRNTIVVLITAGKDDGNNTYVNSHNPATTAQGFLSVAVGAVTKRVPIYVAAVKPAVADETQLRDIATGSGGFYFNVSDVNGVARVINMAVQNGFARATAFDTGAAAEYHPVSPIIGTVNLKNAKNAAGGTLLNTEVLSPAGAVIPQRSNVLLAAGFAVNVPGATTGSVGFDGRLRAFRTFKPEPDSTKPSGYKFVKDGTALWPDVDSRPATAGLARVPKNPDDRNIFTYIPGTGMVRFTVANASTISPHLGGADANTLIPFVRALPLGAIIGSTPALMDPPSLDPPPDDAYGRPDALGTYAGDHVSRRALIWFGANDGMIHGVDARTGFEVWAFIPYNLLPKLRTLLDGQPVDQFDYFVDSSPKIAELKMMVGGVHKWRSLLIIGQGPGGVFYQTFDVTEAGMGGPTPDSDDYTAVLTSFNDPNRVQFLWSFPRYSEFDTAYFGSFTVTDGTSGGKVNVYGDLKSTATLAEKSAGFTWSDPAVGPLNQDRTVNAVIVGSGYFPPVEDQLPGRGVSSPRAGRAMYLLDVQNGTPLGGATACSGSGSTGCVDVGDNSANARKNAIQADPTAAGDYAGAPIVTKAYAGDADGKYWRFNFTSAGVITFTLMNDTGQPIYGSSALLFVGSSDQYMFFATGSDLLPPGTNGGTGTFKLYGLKDNYPAAGATVKFTTNLSAVTDTSGLASGERPSSSPSVAGDIVFYTTTTESASTPCTDFSGKLYGLTFLGGAAYDTNASGSVTSNESPVIRTTAGRATAPFIVDQHLFFSSAGTGGANVEIFGDPEDFNNGVGQVGVRILSWREIR